MPRDPHPEGSAQAGTLALDIEAAARIVRLFSEEPLHPLRVEHIAIRAGVARADAISLLKALERLGVVERKGPEGDIGVAYTLRLADGFLDILERLSRYFTEQVESVAISPERALISSGEAEAELATLRALRARVASLESAKTLLQRKNLELSFLYNTSMLLAGSIEPMTVAQTVIDAIASVARPKVKRFFVAMADKGVLSFYGGHGIDRLGADEFLRHKRQIIESSVERCALLSLPAQMEAGKRVPAFAVLPLTSGEGDPAVGCIVLSEITDEGLGGDDLRVLMQVAEIAGRSLKGAALFSQSISLGSTDELTGAFNRRYLFRRLGEEMTRARNAGRPLGVIVLDVDHFKNVNDEGGHAEGDRVLKAITRAISGATRGIDLVARLGGDEFAVILPSTSSGAAIKIAERMRSAVEKLRLSSAGGKPIAATISCGIASLTESVQTPAQLLASADHYLLEAKRAGRNRTIAMPD